jgi:acyl-CoA thioester hydrolase
MFTHYTNIRVRYAETDQMGVVYHGNYPAYIEEARTDSFRQFGLTYKELEASGIMMPVLEMKFKFLSPAYYDDVITIKTMITKLPEIRIFFDFEIYKEDKLIGTASVVLVCVDALTRKPVKCPQVYIDKLSQFIKA